MLRDASRITELFCSLTLVSWKMVLPDFPTDKYSFRMAKDLDFVGATEIAAAFDLTRQRISQLAATPEFPAPVAKVGQARIWRRSDIEAWAVSTGRVSHKS